MGGLALIREGRIGDAGQKEAGAQSPEELLGCFHVVFLSWLQWRDIHRQLSGKDRADLSNGMTSQSSFKYGNKQRCGNADDSEHQAGKDQYRHIFEGRGPD